MSVKPKLKTFAQLAAILLIAYALKSFYSTASVNDLRWILTPTTILVELITGKQFTFESQAGYMSSDHMFLIAASCSGVNFLIISFLVLALGKIWRRWPTNQAEWGSVPMAAVVAYFSTLAANTTRIVVALYSQNIETNWLDHDQLHRIQGIVIYFGFLLVLYVASEKSALHRGGRSNVGAIFGRRSAYLLVIYYTVTLGIPIVRGSCHDVAFWSHALLVFAIPLVLLALFAVTARIKNRWARCLDADGTVRRPIPHHFNG